MNDARRATIGSPVPRLRFKDLDGVEKVFNMNTKHVIVGRASTCDITLVSPSVSAKHLQLTWSGGLMLAENLSTTSPTLYQSSMSPVGRSTLAPDQILLLGDVRFFWQLPQAPIVDINATLPPTRLSAFAFGAESQNPMGNMGLAQHEAGSVVNLNPLPTAGRHRGSELSSTQFVEIIPNALTPLRGVDLKAEHGQIRPQPPHVVVEMDSPQREERIALSGGRESDPTPLFNLPEPRVGDQAAVARGATSRRLRVVALVGAACAVVLAVLPSSSPAPRDPAATSGGSPLALPKPLDIILPPPPDSEPENEDKHLGAGLELYDQALVLIAQQDVADEALFRAVLTLQEVVKLLDGIRTPTETLSEAQGRLNELEVLLDSRLGDLGMGVRQAMAVGDVKGARKIVNRMARMVPVQANDGAQASSLSVSMKKRGADIEALRQRVEAQAAKQRTAD